MDQVPTPARLPDVPSLAKVGMGVAAMVCLYASLSSSSFATGRGVRDAADGVFAPSATLLAPASPAFALWTLVYLGLLGHAVRIWVPDAGSHGRRRAVMWPGSMAMLLNAVWLACVMRGLVWATIPALLCMMAAVAWTLEGCRRRPAPDWTSLVLIDGTYGLYLGWLLVAGAANVASVAVASGLPATGPGATALALALLALATAGGVAAMARWRGNWGLPLAVVWGLVWIIRARSHEGPASTPVVVAATVCAAVVAASFFWLRGSRAALSEAGR